MSGSIQSTLRSGNSRDRGEAEPAFVGDNEPNASTYEPGGNTINKKDLGSQKVQHLSEQSKSEGS